MSSAGLNLKFSRVGWWRQGYSPRHVDDFFVKIRQLIDNSRGHYDLRPEDVRAVTFPLIRNGYHYRQVDAALDRLELDALDRERAMAYGEGRPEVNFEDDVQTLLDKVRRPRQQRFTRWSPLRRGYSVGEVDAFCERVATTLHGGRGPGLRAVRQVEFHGQRGGYSEEEVDAYLDRIVGVLLRRRY